MVGSDVQTVFETHHLRITDHIYEDDSDERVGVAVGDDLPTIINARQLRDALSIYLGESHSQSLFTIENMQGEVVRTVSGTDLEDAKQRVALETEYSIHELHGASESRQMNGDVAETNENENEPYAVTD